MRLLAAIVALCVYGCYSPHYDDCLVRCMNNGQACPSGFACDGMYCRNGTSQQDCPAILGDAGLGEDGMMQDVPDVGTADDVDGDGVPNADDNCPTVSNLNQDNEDGDMKGDACDPCPPYVTYIVSGNAADADADGDGDGVGDGCDPDPAAVNHILMFDGMNRKPVAPVIEEIGGAAWSFDGEAKATATVSAQRFTINWPVPTGTYVVRSLVTWTGETATGVGAGPFGMGVTGQNSGHACALWNQGGAHTVGLVRLPSSLIGSTPYDYESMTPTDLTYKFDNATGMESCTGPGNPLSTQLANFPIPSVGGITANGISARFAWVMIID